SSTSTHNLFHYNHPSTPIIHTLSLHDALPIYRAHAILHTNDPRRIQSDHPQCLFFGCATVTHRFGRLLRRGIADDHSESCVDHRSEEHTSELQSRGHLVCRLLLEKKKKEKL